MGVQESAKQITPVGVAFGVGCACTDVIIYIPLLLIGLAGYHVQQQQQQEWGRVCLAAALDMTLYWPLEYMFAIQHARSDWDLRDESAKWITLPLLVLWAAASLRYLALVSPATLVPEPKQRGE